MPITTEGQAELDGLELGPGSPYGIKLLDGFGPPAMRTSGYNRPLADGAVAGADYLEGRQVLAVVNLRDGTPAGDLGPVADALAAKFRPRRDTLVAFDYWRPGDPAARRLYVRPRRAKLAVDEWWHHGIRDDVPLELYAPDPRWYALALSSVELEVPSAETGRTYDRVYPLSYGGGTGGTSTANNAGGVETWPTTTITGPITNPRLENVTTGQTLRFALELAAGQTLVVDHHERTVLLGGTASRYSTLVRPVEWWPLEPGDNDLRLAADSSGVGASALVEWRSAWL